MKEGKFNYIQLRLKKLTIDGMHIHASGQSINNHILSTLLKPTGYSA